MSPIAPRFPALGATVIGFGHRGARADAPENTAAGFELACKLGATGIETDAWLTSDGIAVLDHDGVIGPRLRRRKISDTLSTELPEHIPTIDDLYRIAPNLHLSIDVKDPGAFEPIVATARTIDPDGSAEKRLWLCTDSLQQLQQWRSLTTANLVLSTRINDHPNALERLLSDLAASEGDALNLHHTEWTGGQIIMVHRFGLRAFGWGAVHERELVAMLDAGIDAVYSDHVERMMATIERFYPKQP